jgi:hypothetical protein
MSTHTKPVSAYYEHKYAEEDQRTHDIETVLASVNQLQRRLGQLEQESKHMRDAINDIGQHCARATG